MKQLGKIWGWGKYFEVETSKWGTIGEKDETTASKGTFWGCGIVSASSASVEWRFVVSIEEAEEAEIGSEAEAEAEAEEEEESEREEEAEEAEEAEYISEWIDLICFFKEVFKAAAYLQWVQWKGFSFVCVLKWATTWAFKFAR